MLILLDTGILIRLWHRADPFHIPVRKAVHSLRLQGGTFATTHQNVAEFWNVCTRPATARGGLGLSHSLTEKRLRLIERIAVVVHESSSAYAIWKQLVVSLGVMGVQVHDVRLVATMTSLGIANLLTLNPRDFARFSGINVMDVSAPVAIS